jgi:signal transduction histidine kinase
MRPGAWTLRTRLLLGSAVLALVMAFVFYGLAHAMSTLRSASDQERHAKELTSATLVLQNVVADLQTGVLGYVLTPNRTYLAPYTKAHDALPMALESFRALAGNDPEQRRKAKILGQLIEDYNTDWAEPVVELVRSDRGAAKSTLAARLSQRQIAKIRTRFREFLDIEDRRASSAAADADSRSDTAITLGLAAVGVTGIFIVLFGLYLSRAIAQPVDEVAGGARRLAAGELGVRIEEHGAAEVRELTRTFNRMAEALERGRAELERQYERLRQSEQLKTDLIAIVSHELRTPLASMLGFTSLLLQREFDDATKLHYLEIVNAQARRLRSLLDDFLNVQRLEEGRLELASEQVDMAMLLREQTQLFAAESERHRLELRIDDPQLPVRGDPDRLAQVVGNLLSNAIKYSPSGGTVEVVAESENGTVLISVRDEGVGIPEEQRPKIFTKFFRGDAPKSGIAGSGLGLAFARAVVEAHGGRITFTSEVGKGSVFRIELPTQTAAELTTKGG